MVEKNKRQSNLIFTLFASLVLVFIFSIIFLSNFVSGVIIIRSPANHTNHSLTSEMFFNATYLNTTADVITPRNITFFTNISGSHVAIGNTSANHCLGTRPLAGRYCNDTLNISTMANGYHTIFANFSNGTFHPGEVIVRSIRVDNAKPNRFNISAGYLGGSVPVSGSNFSGIINFNVSVLDNNGSVNASGNYASGVTVFANITNGTGIQNGTVQGTRQGTGTGSHWFTVSVNTDAFRDGNYSIAFFATDVVGNRNNTFNTTAYGRASKKSALLFDNTIPSVTATTNDASTTTTTVVIDLALSDFVGINSTCGTDSTGAVVAGTGTTQTITENNLACGTSYTYTITCYDEVRNRRQLTSAHSTDACSSSGGSSSSGGGGGGGGSSSGTVVDWDNTVREDTQDFTEVGSISQELSSSERVSISLGGESHHVGVVSVTSTTAVIEIGSTPQQYSFEIGETKKFDLDEDEYYDLSVTLNSIIAGKASITMQSIHEVIISEEAEEEAQQEEVQYAPPPTTSPIESSNRRTSASALLWIIVGLVVIGVAAFFIIKKRK